MGIISPFFLIVIVIHIKMIIKFYKFFKQMYIGNSHNSLKSRFYFKKLIKGIFF